MADTDDTESHDGSDVTYAGPWAHSQLECLFCNVSWVAVYPVVCMQLECPHCAAMNPAPIVSDHRDDGFRVMILPMPAPLALEHALYYARRDAV